MDFYHYVYIQGKYPLTWNNTIVAAEKSVLLMAQLIEKKGLGYIPENERILASLEANAPIDVRVVIIGEGPYAFHPTGHAFDSETGVQKSLQNIYKELERSIPGFRRPTHGCLMHWVDQGVLLLNKDLTTVPGMDRGHPGYSSGLISLIIQTLQSTKKGIIYLLWGKEAEKVRDMLKDTDIVCSAAHPSPNNTRGGFIGCGHFALVNKILASRGESEIDWHIPAKATDRPLMRSVVSSLLSTLDDKEEKKPVKRTLLKLKDSREDHL